MNFEPGDGFCMELARMLSFTDVCRILNHFSEIQLPGDISSSENDVSKDDGTASEPNNSQFTRLPRDFEISEATGSLLIKLRDYASQPGEFYSSLSKEQWLRTVVSFKGARSLSSADISIDDLIIRCNVVPCEPYWEKLRRARSRKDDTAGVPSKGVYFPSPSLGIRNHACQLTRDSLEQECNILRDWIERFNNEMIDQTDMITRRLRRKIEPSEDDKKQTILSPRLPESSSLERFREEYWKGGLFGVKVFTKGHQNIFLKEVKVLEAIGTHPHIVQSFGVSKPEGEESKEGYKYWMEKLDRDLYQFIIEVSRSGEVAPGEDFPNSSPQLLQDSPGKESSHPSLTDFPFSVLDSMDVLLQIAKAMTRLHELKVIHGDLKSANILLSHYEVLGDVKLCIVKVADFDSAKIIESDNEDVHVSGTDDYAAPEVLRARREKGTEAKLSGSIAKKCDLYSFGIVAVEVLSGQISVGIQKEFLHDKRDDIMAPLKAIGRYHMYPDLIDLVDRCLNHDSSLRLSFAEVTAKLESIIDKATFE